MDNSAPPSEPKPEQAAMSADARMLERQPRQALLKGNREVIADLYVSKTVENEPKDYVTCC